MLSQEADSASPAQEAAARAIRTLDLQTTPLRTPADAPDWQPTIHLPPELLWAIAIVVLLIALYYFLESLRTGRFAQDEAWRIADADLGLGRHAAEASLAAADAMAAEGRFVEAMHLLLLYSLGELRRRLAVEFAESLTSREILRMAKLPERGRSALDGIVSRVELSYFGERPASQADYESCRARFQDLAAALAERRPA